MGMFLRRGTAQRGMLASELEVGQIIKLNVNGKAWEWLVVNQGLTSSIYDASCNGTWLLMKDIYETRVWKSEKNKYESSYIHTYLNNTFLNLFESNIKDAIKQVKLPYRKNGGSGGTTQQGANGLPCKIFLLSAPEVHYEHSYIDSGEGAALSYFASCVTNNADPKRVAYYNGSATRWWLRSPFTNDNYDVWYVGNNGRYYHGDASQSLGIRPAFILPSDFLLTDDMLLPANIKTVSIIGSYFGNGYVMVGETKYSRAIEAFSEIGTTIVAHVGAPDSTGVAGCKIYFNGDLVKTGTSSYSFTLEGNVTIIFKRPDNSTSAIECYIVTQ